MADIQMESLLDARKEPFLTQPLIHKGCECPAEPS